MATTGGKGYTRREARRKKSSGASSGSFEMRMHDKVQQTAEEPVRPRVGLALNADHQKFVEVSEDLYNFLVSNEGFFEEFEALSEDKRSLVVDYMRALSRVELEESPASDSPSKRRGGPPVAPTLYADRPDKSENVVDFIKRVYSPWLDGDFTRADLRHLDKKCASALTSFEHNRGQGRLPLSELNLPTVQERNDRLLEEGLDSQDPAERRRLQHVLSKRDDHQHDL